MKNKPYYISIVVIGYNTIQSLSDTLLSINKLNVNKQNVEVVYVDDGSHDGSYELFMNYKLKFNKNQFQFNSNQGRVSARSMGVKLSKGEWIVFLNSNVTVDKNLIIEYNKSIQRVDALAFCGLLKYTSQDKMFLKYLNNQNRGINKYQQHQIIHYNNLLFSNCIIKKSVLDEIHFNLDLNCYGGEELDWAYRMHKKYPNMMCASKLAVGTRKNHPIFKKHVLKLVEFGNTNFQLIENILQVDIIKLKILLNKNLAFKILFNSLHAVFLLLYKLGIVNNKIIQMGLLSSILKGYYKKIK